MDKNPERLELAKKQTGNPHLKTIQGDATSALVLENAHIETAYQIVVLISDDKSTEEILKIITSRFHRKNIIARILDEVKAEELRSLDVEIVNPFETSVNLIANQVNMGETIALNIGKGEGEIVQIELTAHSPIVGVPLKELPPRQWVVGAIYRPRKKIRYDESMPYLHRLRVTREDELIIPQGDTVPREGDKLILIGDPHVLRQTAQYLKAGAPLFPVRYGTGVVGIFDRKETDPATYQEFQYLISKMEPCHLSILYLYDRSKEFLQKLQLPEHWEGAPHAKLDLIHSHYYRMHHDLKAVTEKEELGLLIHQKPITLWEKIRNHYRLNYRIIPFLFQNKSPGFFLKGNSPWSGITLYISDKQATLDAAELAIDVSLKFDLRIRAIMVRSPDILAGKIQQSNLEKMMATVHELAALYGTTVEEIRLEGNPVVELIRATKKSELLVLPLNHKRFQSFMIPSATRLILKKYQGSILYVVR